MTKAKFHLFDAAVTLLLVAGLLHSANLGPLFMPSRFRPSSCENGWLDKPPVAPRREAPATLDDFGDFELGSAVFVFDKTIHPEYAFVGTLGRKKATSSDAAGVGVRYDVAFDAGGIVYKDVEPQFIRPLGTFDEGESAMCVKDGASMGRRSQELVACTIVKPLPKEEVDSRRLPAGGYLVRFHDDGDDVLWRSISTTRILRRIVGEESLREEV